MVSLDLESPGIVPSADSSVSLNPFSVQGPMGKDVGYIFIVTSTLNLMETTLLAVSIHCHLPDILAHTDLSSIKVAYSTDLGCAPVDKDIKKIFLNKIKSSKLSLFLF